MSISYLYLSFTLRLVVVGVYLNVPNENSLNEIGKEKKRRMAMRKKRSEYKRLLGVD